MKPEGRSEVARLMAAIQSEYEAGQQAMNGSAYGTSQHTFITKRMENMVHHLKELHMVAGEEIVNQLLIHLGDGPKEITP